MEKVLIIDEDLNTSKLLELHLSNLGYSVNKSNNGKDGLIAAQKLQPDIIILEIILPGMNGFEICKKIKTRKALEDIPIIILTLLKGSDDELYAYEAGADFFLTKPVNLKLLKNRVEALINNKRLMESMEKQKKIVKVLLEIMKKYNKKLYDHSSRVREYCLKVTHIIYLDSSTINKLWIAASLHDFDKLTFHKELVDNKNQIDFLAELKMYSWLKLFVNRKEEKLSGKIDKQLLLALQILNTANRFVELWEMTGNKEKGIEKLKQEINLGLWTKKVGDALNQVIKDEEFLIDFNQENQKK